MSRDSSGNYTLPAGNPVVTNTTITSAWANNTCNDIGAEITNSLDRNGRGGMLAALRLIDGTAGVPAIAFSNETGTGFARLSSGAIAVVINGTKSAHLSGASNRFEGTASYVNGFLFQNAVSGNPVRLTPYSAVDINIGLILDGQGTGRVQVGNQLNASSNPLFTGWQLQGEYIYSQSNVLISSPANTGENQVYSQLIFNNSMGPNGQLIIEPIWMEKQTAAGVSLSTIRIKFDGNTVYTYSDNSNCAALQGIQSTPRIVIINQNAANSQIYGVETGAIATPWPTLAVDTTALKSITITVQKGNAGDTLNLRRVSIAVRPQ